MKRLSIFTQLCSALLLCASAESVHATVTTTNDTEVYTQSNATLAAPPVVMFYVEYSSSLQNSTSCNSLQTAGSDSSLYNSLVSNCSNFQILAPYFVYPDSPGAPQGTDSSGNSIVRSDFSDGKIDNFELLRAALKYVIIGSEHAMKVGAIAAHNDSVNCVGLTPGSNCSNGAYILTPARLLQPADDILGHTFDPTSSSDISSLIQNDPVRRALVTKLNALPSPNSNMWSPNQGKEIYFELYRYLTGMPVYNGHNGWTDYTTDNSCNIGNRDASNNNTCNDSYSYQVAPGLNGTFTTANLGWSMAQDAENGSNSYVSPIDQNCQRIFMINIVNGSGNQQDNSDDAINATIANGGMNMSATYTGGVSNGDDGFQQVITFLHGADLADGAVFPVNLANGGYADIQNVTSYFLAQQVNQVNNDAYYGGTGSAIQLQFDPTSLINAMNQVFTQILSVSTTFVAASIPLNTFNHTQVLNSAFFALFQADKDGNAAWFGDVKKLKLAVDSNQQLYLVDAYGNSAVSASDGRLNNSALTFWTNANGYDIADTTNVTGADPAPYTTPNPADGRAVTRGGAGQQIPGFLSGNNQGNASWLNSWTGARQLWTENLSGVATTPNNGLMTLDWTNINALWPYLLDLNDTAYASNANWPANNYQQYFPSADSGLPAATSSCPTYYTSGASAGTSYTKNSNCTIGNIAADVMAYIRGYNTSGAGATTGNANNARNLTRRWISGDPLHSKPLALSYGARSGFTQTNPDVRIIYGSNDGFMRMVRNTDSSGAEKGNEVWAFMPAEVLRIQKQLMDNAIQPASNQPSSTNLPQHPFGTDGSPAAYVYDTSGTIGDDTSDKAWIYFGLRRGGRGYYSLDVTNPDAPTFKWTITNLRATQFQASNPAISTLPELGYSFATPEVRNLNWGSGIKPVLIFGGGYDLNKDTMNIVGSDDHMGRAIYIVDADTGALVWAATYGTSDNAYSNSTNILTKSAMVDSIPSEVTAVDSNSDGLVDRIYVGDTGGRVWRVDLPGQTPTTTTDPRSTWQANVLLNLGRHYISDLPNDHRFFYRPDVVPSKDSSGNFDGVVIGSGNREHPLGTTTTDYVYMYKDRNVYGPLPSGFTPVTPDLLFDVTDDCLQTNSCTISTSNLSNGWKMQLTTSGEKDLAEAITLRGVIYFTTYVPPTNITVDGNIVSCSPEGTGYQYAISLSDAAAVFPYFSSYGVGSLNVYDRKFELASGGIAGGDVYVSYNGYTGILTPANQALKNLGSQTWQTYWYEKNR